MRILVVIPHYVGHVAVPGVHAALGSAGDPLQRIAALNETIVCLHRNFGPYRATFEGRDIDTSGNTLDIVIATARGGNVLDCIGLDSSLYSVEYIDGPPQHIPFHTQRLMKARAGAYDFYCYVEDDLAIHDPDFFAKLAWFQGTFGKTALLAPTRVETSFAGTPAKVIIDPELTSEFAAPFRRPGQRPRLEAIWHGQRCGFELPRNPHAASFFLTREQLDHWIAQPTFDDRDASWIGAIESAATLSIGRVFDIYKSVEPDPFFLEIHHAGTAFASRYAPPGRVYGDPPVLAIARQALRELKVAGKPLPVSEDKLRRARYERSLRWLTRGLQLELLRRLKGALGLKAN